MCDYQGYEFGAHYPDSICIDGYLWDADDGYSEGDGWVYTHGGELPCPACNTKAWHARFRDEVEERGYFDRDEGMRQDENPFNRHRSVNSNGDFRKFRRWWRRGFVSHRREHLPANAGIEVRDDES